MYQNPGVEMKSLRNDVHNFSVNTHVPSKVYGGLCHDIKYIKKQHEHFMGIVMFICTQIHSGFMDELVCAPPCQVSMWSFNIYVRLV